MDLAAARGADIKPTDKQESPMLRILLAVGILVLNGTTMAAMYKWVDEQGVTHYSQHPPKDNAAQRMTPPPPPAEDPAAAQQRLQEQVDAFDQRRGAAQEEAAAAEKAAAEQERRQQRCEAARRNLQSLQLGGGRRIRTPDGEYVRPTDAYREEQMAQARKIIQENCK